MENETDHHKHCHAAVHLSLEELDALLSLVLTAPESEDVSEEMTARLLRRIADAQREIVAPRVKSGHEAVASLACSRP